jgi:hypothetical protein
VLSAVIDHCTVGLRQLPFPVIETYAVVSHVTKVVIEINLRFAEFFPEILCSESESKKNSSPHSIIVALFRENIANRKRGEAAHEKRTKTPTTFITATIEQTPT